MTEACANCRYWRDIGERESGVCARRAPVAIPVVTGQAATKTAWPTTHGENWCGDYAPAPKET